MTWKYFPPFWRMSVSWICDKISDIWWSLIPLHWHRDDIHSAESVHARSTQHLCHSMMLLMLFSLGSPQTGMISCAASARAGTFNTSMSARRPRPVSVNPFLSLLLCSWVTFIPGRVSPWSVPNASLRSISSPTFDVFIFTSNFPCGEKHTPPHIQDACRSCQGESLTPRP